MAMEMKRLIEKISESPFWHNFFRTVLNGGQFREKIEPLIEAKENDKVLDVCCGLGNYSLMFKGDYTGVDFDEKYIGYAMKKYGSGKRKFICQDIRKIKFEEKHFDRAIMINAVHHFSDEENIEIFKKVSSFVKDEFVIVDADLGTSNFVQKTLLGFDNGKHVRTAAEIEKLASYVFDVRKTVHFNTRTKSVSLCLIKCSIKREDENI